MEFKDVVKIRNRMCDYYKKCDGCPLAGTQFGCVSGMAEVENADEYERIIENWAKEHPVVTNVDKYIEVMKNTFGEDVDKTVIRESCIGNFLGIECIKHCSECYKWWDEEYKEPKKEGKANEQI